MGWWWEMWNVKYKVTVKLIGKNLIGESTFMYQN